MKLSELINQLQKIENKKDYNVLFSYYDTEDGKNVYDTDYGIDYDDDDNLIFEV